MNVKFDKVKYLHCPRESSYKVNYLLKYTKYVSSLQKWHLHILQSDTNPSCQLRGESTVDKSTACAPPQTTQ